MSFAHRQLDPATQPESDDPSDYVREKNAKILDLLLSISSDSTVAWRRVSAGRPEAAQSLLAKLRLSLRQLEQLTEVEDGSPF